MTNRISFKSIHWKFIARVSTYTILIILGIYLSVTLFILYSTVHIFGWDWNHTFKPAIVGGNPYKLSSFFSPPWVIILLAPFAWLPPGLDMIAIIVVSVAAWILALRKLRAPLIVTLLLLMTPQLLFGILSGNIDFLLPLGLLLPPPLGLFFVLAKPQIGAGLAIFWIIESFQRGGWKQALITITPIAAVSLFFCIPFGFWPMQLVDAVGTSWNISPFPYLTGAGIILLIRAIQTHRSGLAIISSLFMSPYMSPHSLPIVVLGLLPSKMESILVIISLWTAWMIRGIS